MLAALASPEYSGTLLANVQDTQDGVSPLHLVTYVLLNRGEAGENGPLRK